MKYKLAPADYVGIFLCLLVAYIFTHMIYVSYAYRVPCQEICYPQSSGVGMTLFTTELSCICDLTKERIEIP